MLESRHLSMLCIKWGESEHQEYLRGGVVHVQMEDIEGYTVAMAKWIPGEVREKE